MPEMKLPPEIQAKLDEYEKLKAAHEATLSEKDLLEAKLIARGIQADANGVTPLDNGNFKYKIDLPPSGGISLTINGIAYYHGQTYEFTHDQLSTVREMVYRSWVHEETIKGSNENAYRPELRPVLNGRARFA